MLQLSVLIYSPAVIITQIEATEKKILQELPAFPETTKPIFSNDSFLLIAGPNGRAV